MGEMPARRPMLIDDNWEATEIGNPQGGVISPLISNVYLDAFDQEMKRRGHRHVVHARKGVKFLGVRITLRWTQIQRQKVSAFKEKVKTFTRRNSPVNLAKVIADPTPLRRGFANYFRMANCKSLFGEMMS